MLGTQKPLIEADMRIKSLCLLSCLLLIQIFIPAMAQNKAPRQTITLLDLSNKGFKKEFKADELLKNLPNKTFTILDPYNLNKETTFTGVMLADFLNKYAKANYQKIKINSIDGYTIEMTKEKIEELKLLVAVKITKGFLTIDNMGPARLISEIQGEMSQEDQIRIGFSWVWQLKTISVLK